eukprot:9388868-Pyramimonas_sp.AAC.1
MCIRDSPQCPRPPPSPVLADSSSLSPAQRAGWAFRVRLPSILVTLKLTHWQQFHTRRAGRFQNVALASNICQSSTY